MTKLTTGHDSTLGNYITLTSLVFGKDSRAVKYLQQKVAASAKGEDEEVLAPESQMIMLLMAEHKKGEQQRA